MRARVCVCVVFSVCGVFIECWRSVVRLLVVHWCNFGGISVTYY